MRGAPNAYLSIPWWRTLTAGGVVFAVITAFVLLVAVLAGVIAIALGVRATLLSGDAPRSDAMVEAAMRRLGGNWRSLRWWPLPVIGVIAIQLVAIPIVFLGVVLLWWLDVYQPTGSSPMLCVSFGVAIAIMARASLQTIRSDRATFRQLLREGEIVAAQVVSVTTMRGGLELRVAPVERPEPAYELQLAAQPAPSWAVVGGAVRLLVGRGDHDAILLVERGEHVVRVVPERWVCSRLAAIQIATLPKARLVRRDAPRISPRAD
jgi:hypothetical protein